MAHKIITINRQSGSGGAYIGARAAEELGITCYNKQLLDMAMEYGDLSRAKHAKVFRGSDEKRPNLGFYRLYLEGNEKVKDEMPAPDIVFNLQKELILDIASKEDAIIIGRCGNWILENEDVSLLTVCMVAPMEDRIQRVCANSDMSKAMAKRYITKIDKQRSDYYYYMTKRQWGSMEYYDMALNSGQLGDDRCVELLVNSFRKYL